MAAPTSVLFDLDDTLTDRRRSIGRYLRAFLDEFGALLLPSDPSEIERLIIEADRNGYYSALASDLCRLLPWQSVPAVTAIEEHWDAYFPTSAVASAGMSEVIEYLRGRNVSLGIVTNGHIDAQESKIRVLGIQDAFDTIVISESEGCKKPDPRLFEAALSRLGERAESTWFVGDHPANDIMGAENAGLITVWFRAHHPWPEGSQRPQMSISSLQDLPHLIETAGSTISKCVESARPSGFTPRS